MRYLVEFDSGREHYLTCPGVKPGADMPAMPEGSKSNVPAQPSAPASIPSNGAEGESGEEFDGEGEREAQAKADTGAGAESGDSSESESERESEDETSEDGPRKPKRIPTADRAPKREGTDHKLQPTLNRWVELRLNIMLVGPPGGGKTEGARRAAAAIGVPYFERSMGPQTSQWDLVGFVGPNGNYVPSVAYVAFKDGGVLMLDEMDAANPAVLVVLNSLMANGHYTFPNGEQVSKHGDFVLIAGANTYGRGADRMMVGRNQLDAATLDRFAVLDWDYDERIEAIWAGADTVAKEWTAYVQRVRAQAVKLSLRFIVSPRASIYGARMLRAGIVRSEVEDAVLWKGLSKDERARFAQVVR